MSRDLGLSEKNRGSFLLCQTPDLKMQGSSFRLMQAPDSQKVQGKGVAKGIEHISGIMA